MPNALEQALAELKQLPEDAQDVVVEEFLELIRSEAKWDQLFADPLSEALMTRMAAKVRADAAVGQVTDGDPSDRDAT